MYYFHILSSLENRIVPSWSVWAYLELEKLLARNRVKVGVKAQFAGRRTARAIVNKLSVEVETLFEVREFTHSAASSMLFPLVRPKFSVVSTIFGTREPIFVHFIHYRIQGTLRKRGVGTIICLWPKPMNGERVRTFAFLHGENPGTRLFERSLTGVSGGSQHCHAEYKKNERRSHVGRRGCAQLILRTLKKALQTHYNNNNKNIPP